MNIPPLNLVFEPIDFCPLKCPSCPTGRKETKATFKELIPETLEKILETISSQATINRISLFRWGEPLMCESLPELVKIAKPYGRTYVSTTGHGTKCDLRELVKAEPDVFIVATSGITQAIYETTHTGGKVQKFFELCIRLVNLRAKNVVICYHRYNNNLHEEDLARDYAKRLGFKFTAHWANHMPVEDLILGKGNEYLVVPVLDRLILGKKEPHYICGFQTSELSFDYLGNVTGCSVAHRNDMMGNILNVSLEEILENKKKYFLCDSCYKTGAYKQACGLSIDTDKESAKRSGAGTREQFRYFVERLKKHYWRNKELRKV